MICGGWYPCIDWKDHAPVLLHDNNSALYFMAFEIGKDHNVGPRAYSNAANDAVGQQSRRRLLNFIDTFVKLYNEGDFESLLSMLAMTCTENAVVRTCLEAPPSTNNRKSIGVLLGDHRAIPYANQERTVSSVLLVWALLYSAHSGGVMKVIDKRICHRVTVKNTTATTSTTTQLDQLPEEIATHIHEPTAAPTSTLEVVTTLCGQCIAEQSLQQVLKQILSDHSNGDPPQTGEPVGTHKRHRAVSTTGQEDQEGPQEGPSETSEPSAVVGRALPLLLASYLQGSADGNRSNSGVSGQVQGQRRRYLIEFRLQFDEHDLVTHWTTTVLAAEPEEVFVRKVG